MSLAIIGGSGFGELEQFEVTKKHDLDTPYGKVSAPILQGNLFGVENIFFLARHGEKHSIQPHKINYRANIYALRELGIKNIVALAAVGGIDKRCAPGSVIIPQQILDYTYGREMTFFDQEGDVSHAEFTEPYSAVMRNIVIDACSKGSIETINEGVYAVTQGPRFETAAEISRYERDGATIVGMTAMPEAILARELDIAYMTIALSVNYAAGIQQGVINHTDIHAAYTSAADKLYQLLRVSTEELKESKTDVPDLITP